MSTQTQQPDTEDRDREELAAQLEVLREENTRLRNEYARARRVEYKRSAQGFAVIGVGAILASLVFPAAREVLVTLGATGLFGALLTYYLTPEQVLPASVGERIYAAAARNGSRLGDELGISVPGVYVPDVDGGVRLFLPQNESYTIPEAEDLEDVFVVTDSAEERGVSLHPTGEALLSEFLTVLSGDLGENPRAIADQLRDGVVDQFELVRAATVDIEADGGHARIAITDSAYGDVERFDHPIPSFFASGFATGLGVPVEASVEPATDDRYDTVILCDFASETDGE